jgi:polyisoprenoid-binding protein YceI
MQKLFSAPIRLAITLLSALPLGLAATASAQQTLIPAQSEIVFTSKQMGVPVDGKFKKFETQMNFDPKKPETSKVAFTVDLSSVDIGNTETERELTKPGWFNSAKVPTATFSSSVIKATGGGKFEITGKLAIKGNVRDVTVPVSLTQTGTTTTARGEFTIKRLEFKIGDGDWNDPSLVANDVLVKVKLAVAGMQPL